MQSGVRVQHIVAWEDGLNSWLATWPGPYPQTHPSPANFFCGAYLTISPQQKGPEKVIGPGSSSQR